MVCPAASPPSAWFRAWDAANHVALFQLDGGQAVAFDPVAAGFPVAASPRVTVKRLALRANDTGPTDHFGLGSAGSIRASFANVKTN